MAGIDDVRREFVRMRAGLEERSTYLSLAVVVLALLSFGAIIWYAYPHGEGGDTSIAAVPLIRAETTPIRRKPDDPGGMSIPFQDSTVFERLEADTADVMIENLLEESDFVTEPEKMDDEALSVPARIRDEAEGVEAIDSKNLDGRKIDVGKIGFEGAKSLVLTERTLSDISQKNVVEPIASPLPKPPVKPKRKPSAQTIPASSVAGATAVQSTRSLAKPPDGITAIRNLKSFSDGTVYIQLGSLSSRESANVEWQRLKQKFPTYLGDLSLDIQRVDLGAKGVYYRVRGGPLPTERAKQICAKLKPQNPGGCILVSK